jgi:hypothetical protein
MLYPHIQFLFIARLTLGLESLVKVAIIAVVHCWTSDLVASNLIFMSIIIMLLHVRNIASMNIFLLKCIDAIFFRILIDFFKSVHWCIILKFVW